jgi:hypothetical protein
LLKVASSGFASNQKYGRLLNCTYTIIAPDLGSSGPAPVIELSFNEFGTEACCDFVDIFDGPNVNSKQLGSSMSGVTADNEKSIVSKKFLSTGPTMTVRFESDSMVQEKGWGANYRYIVPQADNSGSKSPRTKFSGN